MPTVIKPIRKNRRTAWRKKYLTQSQRWGKVVITMPVPQGQITSSEGWNTSQPQDVQLPEEPTEVEEKEEEREDVE